MILFDLYGTESNPIYQDLQVANLSRQYDFLRSVVSAAVASETPFLSQHVIKALNFQAIICLHANAGEYRPCPVSVGSYSPPQHYQVQALMDDFVNRINRSWDASDPLVLASYVLWRLNSIHPFINGNGRTARAASYFVLCVALGGWLPGKEILPDMLVKNRPRYIEALKAIDETSRYGNPNLNNLHSLMAELLEAQLKSTGA